MSAFFVNPAVIDDVVFIMLKQPDDEAPWSPEEKQQRGTALGRELWAMNAEALRQRYELDGTDELFAMLDDAKTYEYREPNGIPGVQKFKSLGCFTYQCYEGNVPETDLFKRVSAFEKMLDSYFSGPTLRAAYELAKWNRERTTNAESAHA